ncbi:MAG: AAA family ATPase [Desulfomonile tiedjei]|nr:AAA family ATPase [Desulfomonile tiedjei]
MKCPKCQFENPAGMNFCGECGTSLQATDANPGFLPEPAKPTFIPEPERKHVTALFSDLSGYTAMTEKLDPEQVKEITSRIFTGVKQIVAKYEGFIERVMGDGCLAFFGIPRAHEDDPIRAIHSAMEIHELVKGLSPQYDARVGAPLTMHSGINTGLVVTADVDPEKGTHGVAGDAVNVASRLSGMAGPDEIFVGAETVRRAQTRFVFDDLGPRRTKGKAEPINVFKVISAMLPTRGISSDRQVFSEMVGRDKELDKLEFQVMKAINGEGSVVNVIGEAGIGKSRLIAELKKSHIMKRVTLLEGRAISIGKNLSFHPIIDLLKQWSGIAEGDSEAAAFDKLEKAIRQVHPDETQEILPFVATLMSMKLMGKHAERVKGIEGEALEKLIFKNVRELVIKGAQLRPTVVVMEDLHWADTSSIELLEALCRLAEKHRIAFINVFRPGYFATDDGKIASIGTRLPGCYVEITIQPLDQTNSETLIDNMLAIKGLPYAVKNQIVERAGGNPFFIEEVVRSLIDEGAVVKRDGGFEVTEKIEKVVIPPTINDVLMARIDRLEERTKELVKMASVIGRSFFDRVIKDVADSIENVDRRLEYLKGIQLIRDRMRMQELEYLFKHALAQEAAYESTLLQQRKALHLKVAQSIEKIFRERLHEFYGMLAFHYSKGEDPDKAEEYMTKAGEEALRSSASSEALNYFRDALRLYEGRCGSAADPKKLAWFEKNLALAHYNRGRASEAVLYFDQALNREGYRCSTGKLAPVIRAMHDLFTIAVLLYFPVQRRMRVPNPREVEILDLMYKRALSLVQVNNRRMFFEMLSTAKRVLNLDIRSVPQGLAWASGSAAPFYAPALSYSISERLLKRAEAIRKDWKGSGEISYAANRLLNALYTGLWNSVADLDDSLLDQGVRSGELDMVVIYTHNLGILKIEQGSFDSADLLAQKLLWISDSYDHAVARMFYENLLAAISVRTLRLHQTILSVEKTVFLTDEVGFEPHRLRFLGHRATAEALLGETKLCQRSIRDGELILSEQGRVIPLFLAPFLVGRFLTHIHLMKDGFRSGSQSDSLHQKRTAYRTAKQAVRASKKYAPYRTWILRLVGDYYWLIGRQRKALKWWDRSIKEGERLGARPDLSRTYFEVGKSLLEPQSKYKQLNGIDANGYLEKAETLFKEMGLERDLEELERVRQGP